MKTLINIIKLSQGLVIIAFIVFAVLGASALDSKEIITRGDWTTYGYTLVWMGLILVLFQGVGNEMIRHFRASECKKERERQKELAKVAYDVRVYVFGCDVREMNN